MAEGDRALRRRGGRGCAGREGLGERERGEKLQGMIERLIWRLA